MKVGVQNHTDNCFLRSSFSYTSWISSGFILSIFFQIRICVQPITMPSREFDTVPLVLVVVELPVAPPERYHSVSCHLVSLKQFKYYTQQCPEMQEPFMSLRFLCYTPQGLPRNYPQWAQLMVSQSSPGELVYSQTLTQTLLNNMPHLIGISMNNMP